jgi:hypothetical protein
VPHTPYVPPHPHRGTKYHRYTLLLLPQPSAEPIDGPPLAADTRGRFDVRAFCAHYGIEPATGGAGHMWREVWSEDVSKMYGSRLGRSPFAIVLGECADILRRGRGAALCAATQAGPVCRGQEDVEVSGCLIRLPYMRLISYCCTVRPCLTSYR